MTAATSPSGVASRAVAATASPRASASAAVAANADSSLDFSGIQRLIELLRFEIILIWYVMLIFVKFNLEAYFSSLINLFFP